VPSLKKG